MKNTWHLFEFQDQDWVPYSLRYTLFEALECCNVILPYYQWVSKNILLRAVPEKFQQIVELGAGTAPITQRLAQDRRTNDMQLITCDLKPAIEIYEDLEQQYPDKVKAITTPVDFSQPHAWESSTLLVLSATFHHIAPQERLKVLRVLTQSAAGIMIFEPLRKTPISLLLAMLTIIPAVLLPLLLLTKSGQLRRFFWCWLFPLAPLMFVWDSIVSTIRQWDQRQWRRAIEGEIKTREPMLKTSLNAQLVSW
jgi:hypothetical protein